MTDDRKHIRRLLALTLLRLDSHVESEVERAEADLCEALLLLQTMRKVNPVRAAIQRLLDDPKAGG